MKWTKEEVKDLKELTRKNTSTETATILSEIHGRIFTTNAVTSKLNRMSKRKPITVPTRVTWIQMA